MPQLLTQKQTQLMHEIVKFIDENKMPPSREELAKLMGHKSSNATQEMLLILARKNHITLRPHTARGIVPCEQWQKVH